MELAFFPYAVVLQVTPIVAIAPLILIWVDNVTVGAAGLRLDRRLLPDPVEHVLGLNSADRNLLDLFRLYGASRWQTLWLLRLPAALPYFLAGLRVSGGLALIGAVVAEFVAGAGGTGSGLAFRILEAGYQLQDPADVRGAGADLAGGHRDLRGARAGLSTCCCGAGTRAR